MLTALFTMVTVALMMTAARTDEMSIRFKETIRCNLPEDSHIYTCNLENLKYHLGVVPLKAHCSGQKKSEVSN